ncbi:uncharacterized protein LOC120092940 isoform X7 [Benincasa hispida]|uniref:uncharacterized protein LOC120092940 isoform X7 n=1 Tax=Benincasa hispida TaxID=102211 RepID=UPI001900040E|nr:uncharacterized protein LOC120092940 isoform X7 [Benincasa hispida]
MLSSHSRICFRCGQKGHMSDRCPRKNAPEHKGQPVSLFQGGPSHQQQQGRVFSTTRREAEKSFTVVTDLSLGNCWSGCPAGLRSFSTSFVWERVQLKLQLWNFDSRLFHSKEKINLLVILGLNLRK